MFGRVGGEVTKTKSSFSCQLILEIKTFPTRLFMLQGFMLAGVEMIDRSEVERRNTSLFMLHSEKQQRQEDNKYLRQNGIRS